MSRATEILSAWAWPEPPTLSPVSSGLINETHRVTIRGSTTAFLQRLNTGIFVPEVHHDIEAVTTRLEEAGLQTPRLVRTDRGALWATDPDGGVWRCLSPVGDRTIEKVSDLGDARSAAALVARFHAAVHGMAYAFQSVRAGAQDTEKHLANLRAALANHREHRLYDAVAPIAEDAFAAWDAGEGVPELPTRIIHGDLKISNIRFAGPDAVALIDLDTMAHGTFDVELGDALRSWCNPASEDATDAVFDLDIFEAAMLGYAQEPASEGVSEDEWASVVPGIARISLNLTARFAADALQESYFGFDPKYGTRGDHNLLRARGQWSLSQKVTQSRSDAERRLATARGR